MDQLIHAILTRNKVGIMTAAEELGLLVRGLIDASQIQRMMTPYKHLVSGFKFAIGWVAVWTLIQSIVFGSNISEQTNTDALKIINIIKLHNNATVAIKAALPQPIWEEIMDNF